MSKPFNPYDYRNLKLTDKDNQKLRWMVSVNRITQPMHQGLCFWYLQMWDVMQN